MTAMAMAMAHCSGNVLSSACVLLMVLVSTAYSCMLALFQLPLPTSFGPVCVSTAPRSSKKQDPSSKGKAGAWGCAVSGASAGGFRLPGPGGALIAQSPVATPLAYPDAPMSSCAI